MDKIEPDKQATPFPVKKFRRIFFVGVIGTILGFTLLSKLRDGAENTGITQQVSPESILPELQPKDAIASTSPFFPYNDAKHPIAESAVEPNLPIDSSSQPNVARVVTSHSESSSQTQKEIMPDFTIQLIGLNNKKRVDRFIETHQISAKTQTVKTKRNGKDWYIVLYGEYTERETALEAIQTLPSALKALNPWPRRLSEISP